MRERPVFFLPGSMVPWLRRVGAWHRVTLGV